ncbi:MAG TPA: hypothetical protein VFE23_06215 [Usitatibacter sp.]|jgi:hypothetical protein|nr:hypothetical protein [Usitatibacter sp.]
MSTILRFAPACALTSILILATGSAWAQADAGNGDAAQSPGDAQGDDSGNAAGAASKLPGVPVERNIFVPVDGSGHPTSNEYIVVERRVLTPRDGSGEPDDASSAPDGQDVPTRFILVPQEGGDDSGVGNGSGPDAPSQ